MKNMARRLKEDDFEYLNGWIWDRSRAVRVELTKNYRRKEDIDTYMSCYEMCMRFHLVSMHLMARAKARGKEYSRNHDWEQLAATCNQITELWGTENVYVALDKKTPSPFKPSRVAEIHAYNIILGLKERDHREEVRRDSRVKTAHAIVRAAEDTKNPVMFWNLIRSSQVSYLMACAAATRFNAVRKDTLESMVKGYMVQKQRVDEWTSSKLVDILGFDNEDQVTMFCGAYGGEFEPDGEGSTRLRPETLNMRQIPVDLEKQYFSNYVEAKRHDRNLCAILLGYSLAQAHQEGLLDAVSERDEDSLFIPDSSASNTITFAKPTNGVSPPTSTPLNPFASAATKPNPPAVPSTPNPMNPFASAAAKLNSSEPMVPTAPSSNPFAAAANTNTLAKPATTDAFQASAATKANPFGTVTNQATKNPFGLPTTSNGFGLPKTASDTRTPATGDKPETTSTTSSLLPSTTGASPKFPNFSFSGPLNGLSETSTSSTPSTGSTMFTGFATSSASPAGTTLSATAPAFQNPSPTTLTSPTEDEKRERQEAEQAKAKAEEAQRRAREEEEQRVKAERQRAAEEQRRRAQEEQQRKALEEQARLRAAEQQRQIQIQKQQEAARRAEEERKQALQALGKHLMEDPRDGLLRQYIQNLVVNIVRNSEQALRRERQAQDNALADRMWEQKRTKLARDAFYKWCQVIDHRRRKAEARRIRERRRQLKAGIEAAKSSRATSVVSSAAPAPEVQPIVDTPVDQPLTVNPIGVTNNPANGVSRSSQPQKSSKSTQRNGEASTQPSGDFSKSYYEARSHVKATQAITDRTKTDYFKLRAMGMKPGSVQKRSFDSSEEESARQMEQKRIRRSTSTTMDPPPRFRQSLPPATSQPTYGGRQSLPAPTTDEERLARYQAIKASLSKSGHAPSHSLDGRMTASRPSTGCVGLGRSIGTATDERPAYWGRTSRFVPQHLYGQPDAIRAYRMQLSGKSSVGSQASPEGQTMKAPNPPNFLSSPIPTQQSYHPSTQTQREVAAEAAMVIEDDADEEDAGEDGVEEWDGYEDNEVDEEEMEDYDSEEEEEEYEPEDYEEEEVRRPQYAPTAGATEHDAIELSD